MNLLGRFSALLLLLGLGYLGFYVYSVVTGLLDPADLVIAGIAAVAVLVAFAAHAVRLRHVLRDHDDPAHAATVNALHFQREQRGF